LGVKRQRQGIFVVSALCERRGVFSMNKQFESRLAVALMFAIFAVAVVFRFLWLETIPGLNGDEAWLGWKAAKAASGAPLDWRTNSGNFTNPFFLLPLVWVHYFFEPSAWLVRIVAALSGVVTLVANFLLCRRIFNETVAWASTILVAVMPMAIAYSRFGWEPSQIPLFAVFIFYSAMAICDSSRPLLHWMLVACLSLFCGFLVHPTMAFLGLFIALGLIARWFHPERTRVRATLLFVSGILISALLGFAMYLKAPPWIQPEIAARFHAWAWVSDMPRFFVAWLRNFNGINTFGFIPGSEPRASQILNLGKPWELFQVDWIVGGIFFASIGVLVFGLYRNFRSVQNGSVFQRQVVVLLFAFTLGTLLFGIMNGTCKVAVWFDRYALWSLIPGCMILGLAYSACVCHLKSNFFPLRWAGVAFCLFMLSFFYQKYFMHFKKCGGGAGMDSRVATTQIKKTAAELMVDWQLSQPPSSKPVLISSDWFAFWPIAYYMQRKRAADSWEMVYAGAEAPEQLRGMHKFRERFADRKVVVAEFDGVDAWEKWKEVFPEKSWDENALLLKDIAGRPNLRLDFPVSDAERAGAL